RIDDRCRHRSVRDEVVLFVELAARGRRKAQRQGRRSEHTDPKSAVAHHDYSFQWSGGRKSRREQDNCQEAVVEIQSKGWSATTHEIRAKKELTTVVARIRES